MNFKRWICLLLVLLACLGCFAGCQTPDEPDDPNDTGESESNDDTGDTSESSDDESTEQVDPTVQSGLEENYDFGGTKEFVILSRSETSYEFESDAGLQGSAVESAIYERNEEVMQRCNVELSVIPVLGNWDSMEDFMGVVRNDAKLTQSEYDLISTHSAYLMSLALEGLGWDLSEAPNLDLSKRWWSDAFYQQTNYQGAQYIAFGDITYTLYSYMLVVFFNEQIADNAQITEDLYDLALEGEWTFAKLKEYTNKIASDLDTPFESREFGFLTNGHSMRGFMTGFNKDWAILGTDGKYVLNNRLDDSIGKPAQELVELSCENASVYYSTQGINGTGDQNDIFSSGRALFYSQMLGQATTFKGTMKDEYGVLPFPKYDDQQQNYRSGYCDDMSAIMVPYSCEDVTMSGTVVEMLSELSYREVTLAYYEETLKYQSFNNPKCVKTIELIRTTFSPLFTSVYGVNLDTISATVANVVESNLKSGAKGTISGYYSNYIGGWRRNITNLYKTLDKIAAARQESAA